MALVHPLAPVFDKDSAVLILGSFPSVQSRAALFYYAHPQNRFWRVLSAVFGAPLPQTVAEKTSLLLSNRLALWDCIGSCEIEGSQDSSIRSAVPNDIPALLRKTAVTRIYCNGGTAHRIYTRSIAPLTGIEAVRLPSTSPANAACSLAQLIAAWQAVVL